MDSLIEPNLHPILVHFAYALSITSVLAYLLSGLSRTDKRRQSLLAAADWMLAFSAVAIVATVLAGFQAYYSVGHDTPSHAAMTTHRNWAVPSGLAMLALAGWRWLQHHKPPSRFFMLLLVFAALSLSVTAWWGGRLVFNYGLGVKSLPMISGEGHDHDHGEDSHDGSSQHEDHVDLPNLTHNESDGRHQESAATIDPESLEGSPEDIVNLFGQALRSGDEATLREIFVPETVIAEGGRAERSFDQYAGHHMRSDMAFIGAIETTLMKRDTIIGSDVATIVSQSKLHGSFRNQTINSQIMETMVLRKSDGRWRITHVHWSTASLTEEHEH